MMSQRFFATSVIFILLGSKCVCGWMRSLSALEFRAGYFDEDASDVEDDIDNESFSYHSDLPQQQSGLLSTLFDRSAAVFSLFHQILGKWYTYHTIRLPRRRRETSIEEGDTNDQSEYDDEIGTVSYPLKLEFCRDSILLLDIDGILYRTTFQCVKSKGGSSSNPAKVQFEIQDSDSRLLQLYDPQQKSKSKTGNKKVTLFYKGVVKTPSRLFGGKDKTLKIQGKVYRIKGNMFFRRKVRIGSFRGLKRRYYLPRTSHTAIAAFSRTNGSANGADGR